MKESDTFNRRRRRRDANPTSRDEEQQFSANEGLRNYENHNDQRHKSSQRVLDSFYASQENLLRQTKNPFHRFWFWCLETKNKVIDKLSGLTRTQIRLLVIAKFILFLLKVLFLHWLFSMSSSLLSKQFLGRSETDENLNEIPLTVPIFDIPEERDIGGWKWRYARRFFLPPPFSKEAKENQTMPDFGGLQIYRSKETQQQQQQQQQQQLPLPDLPIYGTTGAGIGKNSRFAPPRQIHPDDDVWAYVNWMIETDKFYEDITERHRWPEDTEDEKQECRYPNWVKKYYPLCNEMHQISMLDRNDKHFVGHGSFRDVWLLDHYPITTHDPKITLYQTTLKLTRWDVDFDNYQHMGILNDAVVMERLTSSPRIVDIYGHCGVSVWVEPMPNEVEGKIVNGEGLMKQKDLHDEEELKPQNLYTAEEKLDMALVMAESLAYMHGFRGGVVVHDDIQLAQFLKTPDGILKFGDFNRAFIMPYNTKKEEYCKYKHGDRAWRYRSPEEYAWDTLSADDPRGWMNEKIDVYSFGNGIYALLTGLWVFYDMVDDDDTPRSLVLNGTRAFVDPRWRTRGFIESKLVEVMEQCWTHNADERTSIFEVVRQLRQVKKEYEKNDKKKLGSPVVVG